MSVQAIDPEMAAAVAVFEKDIGEWEAEMEITPAPGAEPIRLAGRSTNRLLGGRWLVSDFKADSGFEGHGVYGWDAGRRRYTSAWVDSQQTAIARGEGTWDPERRTMTFEVSVVHAGKEVRYREITETRPDGSQLYRHLTAGPDGNEFEMIRSLQRRRS